MSDINKIKIQSILIDLFNKHRYIFWYDTDGAMEEFVSTICIEGVEVLILDGNPFGIKYRMLCGNPQPERGYLIYSKSAKPGCSTSKKREPYLQLTWHLSMQQSAISHLN